MLQSPVSPTSASRSPTTARLHLPITPTLSLPPTPRDFSSHPSHLLLRSVRAVQGGLGLMMRLGRAAGRHGRLIPFCHYACGDASSLSDAIAPFAPRSGPDVCRTGAIAAHQCASQRPQVSVHPPAIDAPARANTNSCSIQRWRCPLTVRLPRAPVVQRPCGRRRLCARWGNVCVQSIAFAAPGHRGAPVTIH